MESFRQYILSNVDGENKFWVFTVIPHRLFIYFSMCYSIRYILFKVYRTYLSVSSKVIFLSISWIDFDDINKK